MKTILTCIECGHKEESVSGTELMNKIIMWNHIKSCHPEFAARVMRTYSKVPTNIYDKTLSPTS